MTLSESSTDLKFGDKLAKRGDERRLRLEFMGGAKKVGGGE